MGGPLCGVMTRGKPWCSGLVNPGRGVSVAVLEVDLRRRLCRPGGNTLYPPVCLNRNQGGTAMNHGYDWGRRGCAIYPAAWRDSTDWAAADSTCHAIGCCD